MNRHRLSLAAAVAIVACTPALAWAQTAQWRQPTKIDPASFGVGVSEPDGGAVVAWSNKYRVRLSATVPFSAAADYAPACTTCIWQTRVALDPSGRAAAIVWRTATLATSVLHSRMIAADGALGTAQTIATNPWGTDGDSHDPGLAQFAAMDAAVDSAGRLVVAIDDRDGNPYAYVRSAAGAWSGPTQLDGGGHSYGNDSGAHVLAGAAPAVVVTMRGRVARLATNGTWTSGPLGDSALAQGVKTAMSSTGAVSAIWSEPTGSGPHIFVASAPVDGALGTPEDLGEAGDFSIQAIRYMSNGDLVVASSGPDTGQITVRRRVGTTWSAPSVSPDVGLLTSIGIGTDGSVFAFSRDAISGLTRAWRRPADGSWDASGTALFNYSGNGVNPKLNDGTADEASATVTGGGGLRFLEFTSRALPPLTPPTDSGATRVSGPTTTVRGAVVALCLRAPAAPQLPVVVQRLVAGRWVTIATQTVLTEAGRRCTHVHVRLKRLGDARLRVIVGVKRVRLAPITIRVVRPLRPRIGLGTAPSMMSAGASGIWVMEGAVGVDPGRLRRLDPTSGATVRTVGFAGFGRDLSIADNTAWVVARSSTYAQWWTPGTDLRRIDLRTGSVTSRRITGRVSSVDADAGHVWIGGVLNNSLTRAVMVDRVTGDATSTTATQPSGAFARANADDVEVQGTSVFLAGLGGSAFTVSRASSSTGGIGVSAVNSASTGIVAMSNSVIWGVKATELLQLQPTKVKRYTATKNHMILDVAPSGSKAWALERALQRGADGLFAAHLVQVSQSNGKRTGRVIDLGRMRIATPTTNQVWPLMAEGMPPTLPKLAIANGVAWVLNPYEGTVMRIRLAQPIA